jgi:hypothetical protein
MNRDGHEREQCNGQLPATSFDWASGLESMQAEVMILLKGFDETFSQTVQARYSYTYNEIIWGAKFAPAFEIEQDGDLRLEVNKVGAIEAAAAR